MIVSYCVPAVSAVRPASLLILGDVKRWKRLGHTLPAKDGLYFADLNEITAWMLHEMAPDVILSPVISTTFDAVDIASCLYQVGYLGRYRCISDGFPNLDIIRREVLAVAPDLDFAMIDAKAIWA